MQDNVITNFHPSSISPLVAPYYPTDAQPCLGRSFIVIAAFHYSTIFTHGLQVLHKAFEMVWSRWLWHLKYVLFLWRGHILFSILLFIVTNSQLQSNGRKLILKPSLHLICTNISYPPLHQGFPFTTIIWESGSFWLDIIMDHSFW